MGLSPDVPLVSEGCDGDLSTQMSMVTDAFTCLGEVLLLMALGRPDTWRPRVSDYAHLLGRPFGVNRTVIKYGFMTITHTGFSMRELI